MKVRYVDEGEICRKVRYVDEGEISR